jgi:hypothetical protein
MEVLMTSKRSRLRVLVRPAIAAACLVFVSPVPVHAFSNVCAGCMSVSDLECGVQAAFIIDGCCGNWVDGHTQCVAGYGFAVSCETGKQCMCNSQGNDCDIVRLPG